MADLKSLLPRARQSAIEQMTCRKPRAFENFQQTISDFLRDYLREKLVTHKPPGPVTLYTVGSLARHEFCLYSDIDLWVLDEAPSPGVNEGAWAAWVRETIAPLWDLGLRVSYAIYTRAALGRLASCDFKVLTALADARFVIASPDGHAGAPRLTLFDSCRPPPLAPIYKTVRGLLRELASTPFVGTDYRLEPNLLEDAGGLRDVQRFFWLKKLLGKPNDDTARVRDILASSQLLLNEVRLAVHAAAQRAQETLRFDLQSTVAGMLRFGDAESLLEGLYRAMRDRRRILLDEAELLEKALTPSTESGSPCRGFLRTGDWLESDGPLTLAEGLTLLEVAAELCLRPGTRARAALLSAARQPKAADPESCTTLGRLLSEPRIALVCLPVLHQLELLPLFIPVFSHIFGLVQRDLYHTYTVDAHLVACAQQAAFLLTGEDADASPLLRALARAVRRPQVLIVSALLHDVAKGHNQDHARLGAEWAGPICRRLGLSAEDADRVSWLVRDHLEMSRISQRRDITDPRVVQAFAERRGSVERLTWLYLLSYVDAKTTGPQAFTYFKAQLLTQFFVSTRAYLTPREQSLAASPASRADVRVAELIARARALGRPQLVVEAVDASTRVELAAADRPRLLLDLAGTLAALGFEVRQASVGEAGGGFIYDTFVAEGPLGEVMRDPEAQKTLLAAVDAGLMPTLQARLRERLARPKAPLYDGPATWRIAFASESADVRADVLDVVAPDGPALLWRIASALYPIGVDVVRAHLTTEGRRARDAFYLVERTSCARLTESTRKAVLVALDQISAG